VLSTVPLLSKSQFQALPPTEELVKLVANPTQTVGAEKLAISAGVNTWNWDFDNNGTVDNTTQNPSHTFPSAGTYPVNLEVSIGGNCMHDTTINITVSQSATASFTAPTVCAELATSFTDASSAGVDTWNWDFDNNGTVDNTTQNPSHTFPAVGTYPVNLEVSVGGSCLHDTTINVVVSSSATANFTAPTVCVGLATNFTDASSTGVDTWNWDFDNNGTVDNTTQNPSHTFPSAGTYPVNLEVSVGGSCIHDTTINITVSQSATASFTAPTV
jgi:FOG: PKD repeat